MALRLKAHVVQCKALLCKGIQTDSDTCLVRDYLQLR